MIFLFSDEIQLEGAKDATYAIDISTVSSCYLVSSSRVPQLQARSTVHHHTARHSSLEKQVRRDNRWVCKKRSMVCRLHSGIDRSVP